MNYSSFYLGNIIPSDTLRAQIRNLDISQVSPASAQAVWHNQGGVVNQKSAIYLNGDLAQNLATETNQPAAGGVSALTEGLHNISVVNYLQSDQIPNIYYDLIDGSKIFLSWSTATVDFAGYNIYLKHNDGAWFLADTVTDKKIIGKIKALPNSGSGTGTITVPTIDFLEDFYILPYIEIDYDGMFVFVDGANPPITGEIIPHTTSVLPYGITVHWDSAIDQYEPGDRWNLQAGVVISWKSQELPPGAYDARVSIFNKFGAESDPIELVGQIYIPYFPQSAEPISVVYDDDDDEIIINCAIPSDASEVLVFSNYDVYSNSLEPFIIEDNPLVTLTALESSFELPGDVEENGNEFLFYLFPKSSEDNSILRDFSIHSVNITDAIYPDADVLSEIDNFIVTVGVGGAYTVSFNYLFAEGSTLEKFTLEKSINNGAFVAVEDFQLEITSGFPYAYFKYNSTDNLEADDNPNKIRIVAVGANGDKVYSSEQIINYNGTKPFYEGDLNGGIS